MGISDAHLTLGIIVGVASMLMLRLDRLGKQLEAVSAMIRADLARTEEERSEVLQEWKETKKQAAKDERQFWLFWFVVIAALGLYFNYFR
jgi:type VI protein secretion system component VasK